MGLGGIRLEAGWRVREYSGKQLELEGTWEGLLCNWRASRVEDTRRAWPEKSTKHGSWGLTENEAANGEPA